MGTWEKEGDRVRGSDTETARLPMAVSYRDAVRDLRLEVKVQLDLA
jgi:hypothetical protein